MYWINWVLLDADTSNLRAGIASLFFGTSFMKKQYNRNEQETINEEECLIDMVVGYIFSIYGIYRLEDGFFNHQVTQPIHFGGTRAQ